MLRPLTHKEHKAMADDAHWNKVLAARVAAIEEALRVRAAGPQPKAKKRRRSSAHEDRLHDEGRTPEVPQPKIRDASPGERLSASHRERVFRQTFMNLLGTIEAQEIIPT